ncbi:RimK family alpha-L-glutamate ligase [Nocardioides sp.]|uniref:RimK family alpha-L-glutamate ligase n=1 Tax=Nocardioides sp. TaxID=35761 RepID=UPI003783F68C
MEHRGEAQVPLVLLATSREWAGGEPGHAALDAALSAHGLASRWVVWDDLGVDWGTAEVVAVRSTWDYDGRLGEFLGWASGVGPALLNGAAVFRWNTDKRYLIDLQKAGLPIVPTVSADTVFDVRAAADGFGLAVVKPRVGAGGRGLEVVADGKVWLPKPGGHPGPWVVQPLVESIHHDGEISVFVIAGRPVSQVQKMPSRTDIRVNEQYGGTAHSMELTEKAASLAASAVATVVDLLGEEIVYGRVDMMRYQDRLVVSEVELTEPGLYLDVLPLNALPFAEVVAARAYPRTW